MAMQCLQKQMDFITHFGCFRIALTVATVAGVLSARQLLWHGADPVIEITLPSWLWITLACVDMLGKWLMLS